MGIVRGNVRAHNESPAHGCDRVRDVTFWPYRGRLRVGNLWDGKFSRSGNPQLLDNLAQRPAAACQ
jgi:hypothetical protein